MMSPAWLMPSTTYGQLTTPVMYTKNHLKPPSRKLWQKESIKMEHDNWREYRKSNKDQWDGIESPQFVDFSNLPEIGDSFFNKVTVIVSTPKPNFENGKLPNSFEEEDTLVASFNNVCVSDIKHEPPENAPHILTNGYENCKEEYVVHNASYKVETKGRKENCAKVKKPQTTTVHPFTFDLRQKHREEHKQERINKILEEEKKMKVFRANPVPKFLKARSVPTNTNKNNNNNNGTSDRNDKTENNASEKAQNVNSSEKPIKKNNEIWKKPPFIPSLTKRNSRRPKTPPLRTSLRAEERKRFDNIIKQREKQREEAKQMELAAREKQQEEEIAQLRKQTVHKAQPIRKYKTCLPKTVKRPLTDPMSPLSFKRRRRA